MKLFNKSLVLKKPKQEVITVDVPDIKEYLVQEYERVNNLKLINESLEQQLEQSKEIRLKYDAAMVTLNEYSQRLKHYEEKMLLQNEKITKANHDVMAARDEVNSYKIQFTNAAITKEEIAEEIAEEIKNKIIYNINSHKGNLSKKIVCEIVEKSILKGR